VGVDGPLAHVVSPLHSHFVEEVATLSFRLALSLEVVSALWNTEELELFLSACLHLVINYALGSSSLLHDWHTDNGWFFFCFFIVIHVDVVFVL